jgi:pimeloyl-ACP methyl ester carboxylesterase
VYFSGDYVLRSAKGVSYLSASYAATSPEQIEEDMSDWSSQAQRPAIYLARPGIHGSSGDNNIRRTLREIELMNRALDMLRERYRISSFILAGQSGGGQIIAALLNMRSDIEASAISSGLLSVKQFSTHWKYGGEIPGQLLYDAKSWYDPVDEIENIRRDLPPKIYLISDPEDRSVPFYTQLNYIRRLRSIGLNPQHIYAYAPRPQRHQLAAHGKLAAALLAQGKSGMEIRRALQELDSPPLE